MQHKWANTVPSPWGELTKYKCLVPQKNRLPNALAEEVEGGLNNLEIKLFVVFIFIMTFLHMCEIYSCSGWPISFEINPKPIYFKKKNSLVKSLVMALAKYIKYS